MQSQSDIFFKPEFQWSTLTLLILNTFITLIQKKTKNSSSAEIN